MKKIAGITLGTALLAGIAMVGYVGVADGRKDDTTPNSGLQPREPREVAQVTESTPGAVESEAPPPADTIPAEAATTSVATAIVSAEDAARAPETTEVSAQLAYSDGTTVTAGIVYFIFQNRLNELPHQNPLDKARRMAEAAAVVDEEGSFTLKMKPGNFAMIYDPAAQELPEIPGPDSMSVVRGLAREQVQARIAAIKENAMQGLPITNGKIGDSFVVENRYIRPPVSNFGAIQFQDRAVASIKAVDDAGELISFPATLRLRGKNGDIMEPHTPSVSKRAIYEFHDLMPQSYQVFALGTMPRPGAGDKLTTPTVSNDQFVFVGEPLTHEVVVTQPE